MSAEDDVDAESVDDGCCGALVVDVPDFGSADDSETVVGDGDAGSDHIGEGVESGVRDGCGVGAAFAGGVGEHGDAVFFDFEISPIEGAVFVVIDFFSGGFHSRVGWERFFEESDAVCDGGQAEGGGDPVSFAGGVGADVWH